MRLWLANWLYPQINQDVSRIKSRHTEFKLRRNWGQTKVKARSNQGQTKVKLRSNWGQTKVKPRPNQVEVEVKPRWNQGIDLALEWCQLLKLLLHHFIYVYIEIIKIDVYIDEVNVQSLAKRLFLGCMNLLSSCSIGKAFFPDFLTINVCTINVRYRPKGALTHEIEAEDCSCWLACHAGTTSNRKNRLSLPGSRSILQPQSLV